MRSVRRTAQFRRDFKRVKRGVHGSHLDETLLGPSSSWSPMHRFPTATSTIR